MAQTITWQVKLQGTVLDNPGSSPNQAGVTVNKKGPYYWDVLLSDPEAFPLAAGRANSIYEPVGPDYGGACLLMAWSDVQDMQSKSHLPDAWDTDLENAFSVICTVTNNEYTNDPGANSVTIANLWLLQATRVDYGELTDDSVYMVEFVDNAYFAQHAANFLSVNNATNLLAMNMRRVTATWQSNSIYNDRSVYTPPDDPDQNWWYEFGTLYAGGGEYFSSEGFTRFEWETGTGPPDEYDLGYKSTPELAAEGIYPNAGGIFSSVWDFNEGTYTFSDRIFHGYYPAYLPPITNIDLPYNGGKNASAWPGLPYFPKGAPQNVYWCGRNIWIAMHDLLINRLGCTMVRRHDQQYRWDCVLLGAEQEGLEDLEETSLPNLIYDTATIVNPLLTTGQYQVVHHRQTRMAGDFTLDSEIGTCKRLSEPAEIVESDQGESLLTRIIHSDMPGYWFGEGNTTSTIPGTGVNLQDSADDFASHQDIMWRAQAGKKVYIGAMPFQPGSQVKAVYWHDYGDGMFTTVLQYPGPPRRLRGHDGRIEMEVTWADHENFGTPNARKGIKVIPDLCQVIKLTSGTGDDDLYAAQIISAPSPVDCWAHCQQTCDHLVSGSGYIGRFAGVHTDGKAIFEIQDIPGMSCTSIVTSVSGGEGITVGTSKSYIPDRCS
jgi:hypothetical protein